MSPSEIEDQHNSPIPTTPDSKQINFSHSNKTGNNLKFIDLQSPKVRHLLMKSLKKISQDQKEQSIQNHFHKIVRSFPKTFRVHNSILTPEEGIHAVLIEYGSTINAHNQSRQVHDDRDSQIQQNQFTTRAEIFRLTDYDNVHIAESFQSQRLTQNQQRPPSRSENQRFIQEQQSLLQQNLVQALDKLLKISENRANSDSPEYRVSHAVDDSCIIFEVKNDESIQQKSYDSSYKNHTPSQSNQGMFDPQAFETHINNPQSLEKLIFKLASLEKDLRSSSDQNSGQDSPQLSENDLVRQISADQSVILISNQNLIGQMPDSYNEPLRVTRQPSMTHLSVFNLADDFHIEQLYQRLDLMRNDSAQQQPKAMKNEFQSQEHKATIGKTSFFISGQSPQEPSPLLKTPNISEAMSQKSNKMDPTILADKLNEIFQSSESLSVNDEEENFNDEQEIVSDDDFGLQQMSFSQPASTNLGTPIINQSQKLDLQNPETQKGLIQRLAEIKEQQVSEFSC